MLLFFTDNVIVLKLYGVKKMLKIEEKKVFEKKEVVTEAYCDCCKNEINQIEVLGNSKLKFDLDFNNGKTDGAHIHYTAGYSTEFDMQTVEMTLCTICIFKMAMEYKSKITKSDY